MKTRGQILNLIYDMYELDENEAIINYKNCKFRLKTGQTCDKVVSGSVDYCPEHLKTKCVCCNIQATHTCQTLQIGEDKVCRAPLCENTYCQTNHNIKVHINMNYMGGNK